jgi:hypothetical protein
MGTLLTRLSWLMAGLLAALPACASTTWALIHLEGVRPNRSAYFADIFGMTDRRDPAEGLAAFKKLQAEKVPREQWDERLDAMTGRPSLRVVQILESPEGPYARKLELQFDCGRNTVTVAGNTQTYHHNQRSDDGPTGGPHPATAPWVLQARRAGCEERKWRAAIAADLARGGPQTELTRLGMVLATKTQRLADLYEFAWQRLWTDGSKRALSSDRPQETTPPSAQSVAQQEQAQKEIDALMSLIGGKLQNEDAERSFINGVAATLAKKPAFDQKIMAAQAGWTEADLIKFWGVPQQVSELAGARVLTYRNESDERVTQNTVDMKSGQIVGSTTTGLLRQCELSLFLRAGGKVPGPRLVDFQMRGDNCNIDTLGKNRPR